MDELKINVIYEKDWECPCFHLDIPVSYEEDYQIRMLKNNKIPGILSVSGSGRDGGSRYTFRTENSISVEKRYKTQEIDRQMIFSITQQLVETAERLRNHLLDPDCILLAPEFVFEKSGEYSFCYVPVRCRSLCESFHRMTEFFVKKLDYKDTEGIFLAYRLHKETMKEAYDLKQILEDYKKDEEGRRLEEKKKNAVHKKRERMDRSELSDDEEIKRNHISERSFFTLEDGEDRDEGEYEKGHDAYAYSSTMPVREEYARYGPLKKVVNRIRTGRWGDWDDLITEMDGQDE